MRRAILLGAGALLFAGCSSHGADPAPAPAASGASGASGATTAATEPAFNPCDSIDATAVSAALGATVTKETGTAEAPRCALVPQADGDPAFELSYLWFDQGLDAAWKTLKPSGDAPVTSPAIAGAEDTRVVAYTAEAAYAVSAFMQNGALIQTVNALALDTATAPAVDAAVTEILTELSAGAPR